MSSFIERPTWHSGRGINPKIASAATREGVLRRFEEDTRFLFDIEFKFALYFMFSSAMIGIILLRYTYKISLV